MIPYEIIIFLTIISHCINVDQCKTYSRAYMNIIHKNFILHRINAEIQQSFNQWI